MKSNAWAISKVIQERERRLNQPNEKVQGRGSQKNYIDDWVPI
jgi:deoxyribodipyrimidine photolyase